MGGSWEVVNPFGPTFSSQIESSKWKAMRSPVFRA